MNKSQEKTRKFNLLAFEKGRKNTTNKCKSCLNCDIEFIWKIYKPKQNSSKNKLNNDEDDQDVTSLCSNEKKSHQRNIQFQKTFVTKKKGKHTNEYVMNWIETIHKKDTNRRQNYVTLTNKIEYA